MHTKKCVEWEWERERERKGPNGWRRKKQQLVDSTQKLEMPLYKMNFVKIYCFSSTLHGLHHQNLSFFFVFVHVLCEGSLKLTDDGTSLKMKAYIRSEEKRTHKKKIEIKKERRGKNTNGQHWKCLVFVSPIGIFVVRFLRSLGHSRIFNGLAVLLITKNIFGTSFLFSTSLSLSLRSGINLFDLSCKYYYPQSIANSFWYCLYICIYDESFES